MILDDTNGGRQFDFFDNLLGGMDSGRHPQMIQQQQCAKLINATIRGGSIVTRPGFSLLDLTFDSPASKVHFERETIQGARFYSLDRGRIIASIGGHIFTVSPVDGTVKDITPLDVTTANMRNTPQAWLCQAEQYMIVQDGVNAPFIIEGAIVRRAVQGGATPEVPVGSVMAYGQSRLAVANPQGTGFVVGDIKGGSADVINFIAPQYLNEAPGFSLPRYMGNISAMTFIAQQDTGAGAGAFLCFGERGCMSYDFSISRTEWLNTDIAKAVLLHAGASGPNSIVTVNGDVFYRSSDGIRSYRMARAEVEGWGQTPISREVSIYVNTDTPGLLSRAYGVNFDNRMLMTTAPMQRSKSTAHLGLLSLDFDLLRSIAGKASPAWEGVWTGLTPSALVEGRFDDEQRCYAFCADEDGINRIYEITKGDVFDLGTNRIPAVIETKSMTVESPYNLKQLIGADFWLSEIIGATDFRLLWRPDEYAEWSLWHEWQECAAEADCGAGGCVTGVLTPQQVPRRTMPAPPEAQARDGSFADLRFGYAFQFRIEWTGHAKIVKARFHFNPETEKFQGDCAPSEAVCRSMQVCPLDDFEYTISGEFEACADSVIATAVFDLAPAETGTWDLRPYKYASVQGVTWEIYSPDTGTTYIYGPIDNHRMGGIPDFVTVANTNMALRTWCASPFAGDGSNPFDPGGGYGG